jgi:hypothetical protein
MKRFVRSTDFISSSPLRFFDANFFSKFYSQLTMKINNLKTKTTLKRVLINLKIIQFYLNKIKFFKYRVIFF